MTQTSTKSNRHRKSTTTHGSRIYRQALETIFPLERTMTPEQVEGLLTGFRVALDTVGYDYSPRIKEDQ